MSITEELLIFENVRVCVGQHTHTFSNINNDYNESSFGPSFTACVHFKFCAAVSLL